MTEVGSRIALHVFLIKAARARHIPFPFGIAPEPVNRVGGVGGTRVLIQKTQEQVVGLGLVIEVADPGDAPLGGLHVFSRRKRIEEALVGLRGASPIELYPEVVGRSHQAVFRPAA